MPHKQVESKGSKTQILVYDDMYSTRCATNWALYYIFLKYVI